MKPLPQILLDELSAVEGFDKQEFVAAHSQPPVVSVRLNPAKPSSVFADAAHVPWHEQGRYLSERPVFTTDPMFHAGAYYVQEASSMFLGHMLKELVPGMDRLRVLDLCAAPGGKSTLIASLMGRDSLLVSNEVIRSRASILDENMTRWGQMNTWVTSNDPKDFSKLKGYFDVIVVDAPCSGSGLFRKDERALDEWSEANVELCAQRQKRILADVWPSLKENGILIYATCSYSPQEDEDILDWMRIAFKAESLSVDYNTGWGIEEAKSKGNATGYRFFPGKVRGEGFFIAAMRKTDAQAELKQPKFRTKHDAKAYGQCKYLLDGDDWVCIKEGDEYVAIRAAHEADMQLLPKHVYLRKTGVRLGAPAKKDWLPAHDIALSIERDKALPVVEASKEQALKFLKKEDAGFSGLEKGWYIVSFAGLGLGWIKALGNRENNYLPKHWRIRMEINEDDWA